jgi:hypothetical protein
LGFGVFYPTANLEVINLCDLIANLAFNQQGKQLGNLILYPFIHQKSAFFAQKYLADIKTYLGFYYYVLLVQGKQYVLLSTSAVTGTTKMKKDSFP